MSSFYYTDENSSENTWEVLEISKQDNEAELRRRQQQQRLQREEEESIELARQLMAEEAMASYQNAFDLLRQNAQQLSPEDLAALQAVLAEEEREQAMDQEDLVEDDEGNLSYETLLMLGERMGDVKSERWAMESRTHVRKLPVETYCKAALTMDADDSEHQCLVCQCEYNQGDKMRRLPCSHVFHQDCVDQWLQRKDVCPYCRVSIVCK
jgi:hypothetical protein